MLRKVVGVLLVLIMLGSVITPAMATNINENEACKTCNTCKYGKNAKVSIIELEGLEKNEALTKALKDKDFRELMDKLIKNGHKLDLTNSVVRKVIGEYGKAIYVYIPFKAKKGYERVGIGYVISDKGNRAFAIETYKKDGKRFTSAYYFDPDGNIVVLSGDDDYWTCIGLCLALFCLDAPEYCQICGANCYICIAAPDPVFCGLCLACIGSSSSILCNRLCCLTITFYLIFIR